MQPSKMANTILVPKLGVFSCKVEGGNAKNRGKWGKEDQMN